MQHKTPITRFGLVLAALVAALAFTGSAAALIPVDPGLGSPATVTQSRHAAAKKAKKAVRRNTGGYPARNRHVRSIFAPEDP